MLRPMRSSTAFLLCFALLSAGCTSVQDLVSTAPEDYLTLTTTATSIPADGVSTAVITVHVSPAAPTGARTVNFVTSDGFFGFVYDVDVEESLAVTDVDVEADVNGYASVELSGDFIGSAIVEARLDAFARSTRIEFTRAYPDRIGVDVSPLVIGATFDDETDLTVSLGRNLGLISRGAVVSWSATDESGNGIGHFFNITASDENSEAQASYTAGDTDYRGEVTLRAEVRGQATGSVVFTTVTIEVIDP